MTMLSRTTDTAATIRALIRKGDDAFDKAEHDTRKAEQFYTAAGLHLKKLKAAKPEDAAWEYWVKWNCKIGIRRAQELIAIADGRTTLAKVRASKAESMRRLRGKAHHGGAPLDRQAIADNRVAALVAAETLPAPVTQWLTDHPGKTVADFVTATGPPAFDPDAFVERKAIGLEVLAYSLVLPTELDRIIDKLRDIRAKVNWLGDRLNPQDVAAAVQQYRKIITIAQDTVVRLTGDRHARFQSLPETGDGHDQPDGAP